ncbi:hypothetical protein [Kamptonema formosum]|uniref:hypothetical protein n=1 Tax=Kamptonema formosum TaxID=331992 RepID=UPI000345B9A2|nr:hypothetical protein [Oscillatoria sp. PCC 10802]
MRFLDLMYLWAAGGGSEESRNSQGYLPHDRGEWTLHIPGMNPTPQPPPRVRGGGERDEGSFFVTCPIATL